MNTHSIGPQKHYLVTGGCALLSLFSCMFLPFIEVSNETTLSSHPLIFTAMELTGSNWLNLLLSIGLLVVVVKFAFLQNLFALTEIPLATQEYWAKQTIIITALLSLLVNTWTFFNVKQIFDAYTQTENLYSTKPMTGWWLTLICMAAIVANNIWLNRAQAPAKQSSAAANPAVAAERRSTPLNPAGYPPQSQKTPAASYNAGPQMPSGPMPAPANQPPVQQRPVNPPAPMPMNQPAPQQRPVNPPAPMPMNQPAAQQRPINPPAPMPMNQPAAQQRPGNPPAPMPMKPPAPQQRPGNPSPMQQPFSLPGLPQTPPIQPAVQQPINPLPANPPALPQTGGPSIVQQRPFSLPAFAAQPAQPDAQQKPASAPVLPQPVGQPMKQQRPFSLPGLPQTPPIQQAVQQRPANPPTAASAPQPVGQSIVQQRPFSLPALPNAAPQAQPDNPPAPQPKKPGNPKSQFQKPPSQA